MRLYTYWRSTATYRVRIALALKGIDYEPVFVHLLRDGGEQKGAAYRAVNPQMRLPSLELGDGTILHQSSAILEYLEECHPEPPLLPGDAVARAKARAVAAIVGCDVHPLHNAGPLGYLRSRWSRSEAEVSAWIATWMDQGLDAIESLIGDEGFCFGAQPCLADVFLVPQVYAARRFSVSLADHPRIRRVEAAAAGHPAFIRAHPAAQPDAEPT